MAKTETLQEGSTPKVPADKNTSWLPSMFGAARKAVSGRQKTLDEAEKKANSYAKGGMVRRGYGKARGA